MCIGEHNIKFHTESNTKSLTMHIPIWYTDLILKLKNWDFRAFIKKMSKAYLFIYLSGRVTKKDIFSPPVHSPNGYISQDCARP